MEGRICPTIFASIANIILERSLWLQVRWGAIFEGITADKAFCRRFSKLASCHGLVTLSFCSMMTLLKENRLANNLAPHYVRATGTGLQIAIANCAAFIATFTYLQQDA